MKISEFQKLMRDLYIHQDSKRGIRGTFIWLVEEMGELATILNAKDIKKNKASEELADIVAWTGSLANLLDINLEEACVTKYPNKCSKCDSIPCKCEELREG